MIFMVDQLGLELFSMKGTFRMQRYQLMKVAIIAWAMEDAGIC
jgi:hypothetical protein